MDRSALVRQYAAGPAEVAAAVAGLSDDDLDRTPPPEVDPDGWTPRQIVHHLADSEMTSAIRLRRLLAEDAPVIDGYDENAFARRLHYDRRAIQPSIDALPAARTTSTQILDCLDEESWQRAGTHSESGRYSVEDWLEIYAAHAHDHGAQIRRAVG